MSVGRAATTEHVNGFSEPILSAFTCWAWYLKVRHSFCCAVGTVMIVTVNTMTHFSCHSCLLNLNTSELDQAEEARRVLVQVPKLLDY
jgi:hypothetical protein